jgi:hypothetical protein
MGMVSGKVRQIQCRQPLSQAAFEQGHLVPGEKEPATPVNEPGYMFK